MLSLILSQTLQEVFLPLLRFSCLLCFRIPLWSYQYLWWLPIANHLLLFLGIGKWYVNSIDNVSLLRWDSSVICEDLAACYVASRACYWYRTFYARHVIWRLIVDRIGLRYELHLQRLLRALRNRSFAYIRFGVFDGHRFIHSLIAGGCLGVHLLSINVS